jgi:HK97 family phage portal protein
MYKETTNGIERDTKHYLYHLLKLRPNPYMSSSDFWKTVEFNRNYHGHSIVYIDTDPNGKVQALYPLNMKNVTIYVDDAGIIDRDNAIWYEYYEGAKRYLFQTEDVLHFKSMTRDGIQGMSAKDYLRSTVENLQYGTQYQNNYFKGGLTAKGLLQYTGDLDQNSAKRMKARFEELATGMDNVGKILPVPVGFSFTSLNTSMADAQFLELNQLSIRQIASAFGIKQHMINDLSGAKFNNVQQQTEEFYRDTLQSILTMYEQEMAYKLLTETEQLKGYYLEFNVDSILRTDLKTRYEAYGVGIDKGFLKPNEARYKEGLPTVEGGDQLIVNGSMQPLDNVGMAYQQEAEPTDQVDEDVSETESEEPENGLKGGEIVDDEEGNKDADSSD